MNLEDYKETLQSFRKAKSAQDGILLTEAQLATILDFGQITIINRDKIRPNKKLALTKYWYVVDIIINTTMTICKSYKLGFNSLGVSYISFFQNVRMQL